MKEKIYRYFHFITNNLMTLLNVISGQYKKKIIPIFSYCTAGLFTKGFLVVSAKKVL